MEEVNGITETWKKFSNLNPIEVCSRTGVSFNDSLQSYTVGSFGQDIFISLNRQEVFSDSLEGKSLIGFKKYFFELSVLWYLIGAQDIPLSGNLVKPSAVPGGQIFVKGTHVLPVDAIAQKFNHNKESFLTTGSKYGVIETDHGDVAIKLLPFPKLPVYLILWFGDEDFPPSGQLLLDSTCSSHLSTDVIWAVTMVCCLLFSRHP
jgi:hypothetical protein